MVSKFYLILLLVNILNFNLFSQNNVELISQKSRNWCYAATTEMIFKFNNKIITQEEVVCKVKNIKNCLTIVCNSSEAPNFEDPFYKVLPYAQLDSLKNFYLKNSFLGTVIEDLNERSIELAARNGPFIGLFGLNSDLTHAMVVANVFKFSIQSKEYYLLDVKDPGKICSGAEIFMLIDLKNNKLIWHNSETVYSTQISNYSGNNSNISYWNSIFNRPKNFENMKILIPKTEKDKYEILYSKPLSDLCNSGNIDEKYCKYLEKYEQLVQKSRIRNKKLKKYLEILKYEN
jgi:hypothetical protein